MSGQPITRFTHAFGASSAVLGKLFSRLAQPTQARRLRRILIALGLAWVVLACTQLIWALLPPAETTIPEGIVVLNPASVPVSNQQAESPDLDKMLSWHLLGKAEDVTAASTAIVAEVELPTGREGIEEGARETRLDLRLRGIVASTVEGLGHAIIEHKSSQQVYAVEDKLPISGRVILAKVMTDRVVIDNRGTYELIVLFEDTALSSQVAASPVKKSVPAVGEARAIDKRGDSSATALAQSYRQQLYQNPQSLAELVHISAVREEGVLRGYKVTPGSDGEQFAQLGFKKGDLVTSVNGIALDDPGNTVRLYQLMRSAAEAVFELERGDEQLTVSVSLDDTGADQ